jgi:hypothetical protein
MNGYAVQFSVVSCGDQAAMWMQECGFAREPLRLFPETQEAPRKYGHVLSGFIRLAHFQVNKPYVEHFIYK